MTPILEFNEVSYRYPGQDHLALQAFSVALPAAEKIAVVGRNGAGKSTFFLHCNGLYRPNSGQVYFAGQPIQYHRAGLRHLRQRVGLAFQNADDQLFSADVAQDISFGPMNLGLAQDEVHRRVAMAAELCQISHLLQRPTHALSGGEKTRAALAGILAMEPEVLLSDELTANVDPWGRLRIFEIFQQLHTQGKTLILATHDLDIVRRWATFVVVMEAGQALFAGSPDKLLSNSSLLKQTRLNEVWQL
jgi:cobalt/nickel transport system ATP-binding protein